MPQLNQLTNKFPQNQDIHMSTPGHALWVSWHGDLPPAINQTLLNYGGMLVSSSNDQALWFFFTNDVFLALARLYIWDKFEQLPVAIELFPGRLQLTQKREASLAIEAMLASQELYPHERLDIFIHPTSKQSVTFIPGITFERAAMRQGMMSCDWQTPVVDERLPYSSTQTWFVVIHPLGNPIDKKFQAGWSAMFARLEELLQELKLKFIVQDGFVIISLDNLLTMRSFLKKYLSIFDKEKQEGGAYWPCVCVVAEKKNLNFNSDLPKKIGLKWDNLMPDFPYISYRNAYLAGTDFVVKDLRFSGGQTNMDSWCNVMLNENSVSARSIPIIMSSHLASSDSNQECFYCGLHNHSAAECPSRNFFPTQPDSGQNLATLDLDDINKSFRRIELTLASKGAAGFGELLENQSNESTLLRAILDINALSQLRNVSRNWLYKLKEAGPDEETPVRDDSPAWDLLDKLANSPASALPSLDKELAQTITRIPRDPRLRMLRAFILIERDDPAQAITLFKEAAAITPSPALQAWNEYLQARAMESMGQYAQASAMYGQIQRIMPNWKELTYRDMVCRVKMGFAEQITGQVKTLVKSEPEYFNRFLIDPALERGRLLILSSLYDLMEVAKKSAENESAAVNALAARLDAWFPEDHPVQGMMGQKVANLQSLGNINNYLAYLQMVKSRPQLEKDLNDSIQREIEELRNRYKAYLDVLEEIRDEASWFPFPNALRDFSADFNAGAGIINWAFSSNFNDSETFKQAQTKLPQLDEFLHRLKKKLRFLRTARDGTLFGLTMFKTFIWIEIVGLLLCFLGVPAIVFFGDKIGLGWLKYLLAENQWSIQKVLAVIVTVIAIGCGALRTTLVFERKKEKLLQQAREQREKAQATRVREIRKKRLAQAQKAKKEKEEADKKEAQRQLKARMQN